MDGQRITSLWVSSSYIFEVCSSSRSNCWTPWQINLSFLWFEFCHLSEMLNEEWIFAFKWTYWWILWWLYWHSSVLTIFEMKSNLSWVVVQWPGWAVNRSLFPRTGRFFPSPWCPQWLWGLPSFLPYLPTPCSRVLLEKLTGSAASQEIPRIFGTRRFLTILTSAYHLSLSWANSIQSPQPPSHFAKIHLNIILPSTSGSPQWSLSLRFSNQNPVHTSPIPHTRHMPRPSHSSRFYHPHNIG